MAEKSNSIDTPASQDESYAGGKKGNAASMPVKHYPSSTKMATGGGKNTIEGPCELTGGKGLYHRK